MSLSSPDTQWTEPLEVFGYNDAVHFFGSIFEAETNCIEEHNMGQVGWGWEGFCSQL